MDCYYTNVGSVQDKTRLIERVERLAPSSVHLGESTHSHHLHQFFTRDRFGIVRHQRGVSFQFSRAVSVLEWVKSEKYDVIGAIVQQCGSNYIHQGIKPKKQLSQIVRGLDDSRISKFLLHGAL